MINDLSNRTFPALSVIIPAYNAAKYILCAIDSVFIQNYPNIEVIVVDDGSTDQTKDAIKEYKENVIYLHQPHQGASSARNKGLHHAKGDLIAFLDADDLWLPEKLNKQLSILQNNQTDIVFTYIEQFISEEFISATTPSFNIKNKIMPGYCATTMLAKKTVFQKVGYFDVTLTMGEFIQWYVRAKNLNMNMTLLNEVCTKRRIHKNNTSKVNKALKAQYLQIISQHVFNVSS